MFLGFTADYIQEYTILREFYVGDGEIHGVQYLLHNEESGEIKDFFLEKKYLNNLFTWEKGKKEGVEYITIRPLRLSM